MLICINSLNHIRVRYIVQTNNLANNKYFKSYDKDKPPNHIRYLHAYNVYGWAMK